ncbi:MAG: DegT/DnrJ/EryC1/StrS family aminotransferase [Deltaproteobacteria bacterium]|nr:DegT/DnrJ/EryC1/StrS family aminotransferase [Deltaproteobacteria bacterium]
MTGTQLLDSLEGAPIDFEDHLISVAAKAHLRDCVIVSRDKTFESLGLPVYHPADLDDRSVTSDANRAVDFVDLKAQQLAIWKPLEERLHRVLRHGHYIMGPEVAELEKTLGEYVGVKHAIGCSSGTDALLLPLMALGVGPGDAVFTTPFTFIATAEVISLLGATPVFVDIDPLTYNIDPAQLEKAIRALKSGDSSLHPLPTRNSELGTRNSELGTPASQLGTRTWELRAHAEGSDRGRPLRPPRRLRPPAGALHRRRPLSSRRRRPVVRGRVQGQKGLLLRRRGGHELLPGQAPGLLWRRRHGLHQPRRPRRDLPLAPGARKGEGQVRQRAHRPQRPARHAPGRDRLGEI